MFILARRTINYSPAINYPQHSSAINYHYAPKCGRDNIGRLELAVAVLSGALDII